jgi:glycosyltransferase involved in cell wall biosynthesis
MSDIKVLHVIARMNVGGTARYVSEIIKNMPKSTLATGFVQGTEIEDPFLNSIDVLRIKHMGRKVSLVNDFKSWYNLREIVKNTKPNIIHSHTFKAGLVARLIKGKHKHVHTFHGHLFDDRSFSKFEKIVIVFIEKCLSKRTDAFISVGKKVGDELRNRKIGLGKPWLVIAPGVTSLPVLDKKVARNLLNLDESEFLIGWIARTVPVKNPQLFLEVASKLPRETFVMAGGGELLSLIRRNAGENVKVLGWVDASTFLSAVDIVISTSDNEGMSIALIEAQLAGLPCITTDVGSNSEVIQNEITGYVVKGGLFEIIRQIEKLTANSELYNDMSQNAKIHATTKFNLENMILAHQNLYAALEPEGERPI